MTTTKSNARWSSDADSSMLFTRKGAIRRATAWVSYHYTEGGWDVRSYGGARRDNTIDLHAVIKERPAPTPAGRKRAQALAEAIQLCQAHGLVVTVPPTPA